MIGRRARWPQALRSLYEANVYRSKIPVDVHALVCHGAECACGWRSPLRSTEAEAIADRAVHIAVHEQIRR